MPFGSLAQKCLAALGVLLLAASCGKPEGSEFAADDWRSEIGTLKMAVEGDVADPEVARRWTGYSEYLERALGLPVKTFQATDYNGVIQAVSSGQVEFAQMGAGSYANIDAQIGDKASPLFVIRQAEGNTGYYSAIIVAADSPYRSLQDLKGKSIAFVDFNSTSGYLYPRKMMRSEGIDPDTHFSKSMLAGGATEATMALVNGQVDSAMINASGGTPETGFTTGSHLSLIRRGLIGPDEVRIIWTAGPMPNSPIVIRADRPQEFIDLLRGALAVVPYDEPEIWADIGQADGGSFAAVDRSFFSEIIEIRAEDIAARRGLGGQGGAQ